MTVETVRQHLTITIRPAKNSDFEWVAGLMEAALAPFYGGDHRAHAQRIFTTHINGGQDAIGHFSAGQYMFIAEVDGERAGLIHIVDKKQGTAKISPLIVRQDMRGVRGVGSELLAHAEAFARELGARQIYCTVASPNTDALSFFTKKGFRITGTAESHYKRGVDEHMLYKQLVIDTAWDALNVSVVPMVPGEHDDGIRRLVLDDLVGGFLGVDDAWVDALFAGYSRRLSGNVNEKFKLVYVAESGGEVLGVVGATPKKGDPIKLMPLATASEAAFEALIVELPALLAEYGHKLYVHLTPTAWQVACLQRHGWQIEGLFPGGYAPGSVVQQWGRIIKEEGAKTVRTMRIKRPYYDAIGRGTKTIEVRVGYTNIKRVQAGEEIQLVTWDTSRTINVKDVRRYGSFAEMLEHEPWQQIAPDARSKEHVLQILQRIYPPAKEQLGVYAFEIEA